MVSNWMDPDSLWCTKRLQALAVGKQDHLIEAGERDPLSLFSICLSSFPFVSLSHHSILPLSLGCVHSSAPGGSTCNHMQTHKHMHIYFGN